MINITVYKQSSYPASVRKIKAAVKQIFQQNGLVSDAEASVALVSADKIMELARRYLHENARVAGRHSVLSFPVSELSKPFTFPPDNQIHLGEIIISYPHALAEAQKTNRLIDDVVCSLAEHGALHLLGIHHD